MVSWKWDIERKEANQSKCRDERRSDKDVVKVVLTVLKRVRGVTFGWACLNASTRSVPMRNLWRSDVSASVSFASIPMISFLSFSNLESMNLVKL
eukprot:12516578-Ditylum_brightwellii.AAC.1